MKRVFLEFRQPNGASRFWDFGVADDVVGVSVNINITSLLKNLLKISFKPWKGLTTIHCKTRMSALLTTSHGKCESLWHPALGMPLNPDISNSSTNLPMGSHLISQVIVEQLAAMLDWTKGSQIRTRLLQTNLTLPNHSNPCTLRSIPYAHCSLPNT